MRHFNPGASRSPVSNPNNKLFPAVSPRSQTIVKKQRPGANSIATDCPDSVSAVMYPVSWGLSV